MPSVYDWYQQGLAFLASGDAHAAATVLERAVEAEPDKGSLRETLARAYFRSGRVEHALEQFTAALDIDPVNDYAIFGTGLCLGRLGRLYEAIGHLRMATVMRPEVADYGAALRRHELRLRIHEARRPRAAGA